MSSIYGFRAANGCFVSAEGGGGLHLVANRPQLRAWERFVVAELGGDVVHLRVHKGQYVCAEPSGAMVANRSQAQTWEQFTRIDMGHGKIALRSYHGKFVCADLGAFAILVANRARALAWETFEPIYLGEELSISRPVGEY